MRRHSTTETSVNSYRVMPSDLKRHAGKLHSSVPGAQRPEFLFQKDELDQRSDTNATKKPDI